MQRSVLQNATWMIFGGQGLIDLLEAIAKPHRTAAPGLSPSSASLL
jgi:hypothetical protein